MSVLPFPLTGDLAARLAAGLDVEGKILRGLEALGPVAGRDVLLLDGEGSAVAEGMTSIGARLVHGPADEVPADLPDASVDVVVTLWSSFRDVDPERLAAVDRVLRDGGRLLVVHDYGRDDVHHLADSRPELATWSHRKGPFLANGFRVRVLHCFWTFDSPDDAAGFLSAAFGTRGAEVAAGLRRPRLSYNVAVYHRSRGGLDAAAGPPG